MPRITHMTFTPALGGFVEVVDQAFIDDAVHLEPDRAGAAGAGEGDLAIDQFGEHGARGERGEGERVHAGRAGVAGHVVEQPRGVAGERGVVR